MFRTLFRETVKAEMCASSAELEYVRLRATAELARGYVLLVAETHDWEESIRANVHVLLLQSECIHSATEWCVVSRLAIQKRETLIKAMSAVLKYYDSPTTCNARPY